MCQNRFMKYVLNLSTEIKKQRSGSGSFKRWAQGRCLPLPKMHHWSLLSRESALLVGGLPPWGVCPPGKADPPPPRKADPLQEGRTP